MTFSFHVPIAARLALALTTLSGPVLCATSPPAAPVPEPLPPRLFLQTFSVGSQYFNGQAYLIAKPVQQVRAALRAEAGGVLAGFTEKSIDLTPDRNRWESEWYLAWLGNHPQAMKSIAQASLRALDAGTRDQLITPAERTAWGTVITRQSMAATLDKNDDEVRRRVAPPGTRSEWFRNTSGRVLLKPYETGEFITVADVSRFMDRSTPVTLLWYAGARTRRTVDGFDFFYCMTGVTCFVAPQIKYASDTSAFERPQVTQLLQGIAQFLFLFLIMLYINDNVLIR